MCGEHFIISARGLGKTGSSPHVRGALRPSATIGLGCGIIPACAGSTLFCHRFFGRFRDHPRMCGEHLPESAICGHSRGSSPHVRGAQNLLPIMQDLDGIIPACAGSTCARLSARLEHGDHPRMCGEHATPRTDTPDSTGIIPACAGSTSVCFLGKFLVGDHPRMCGEHFNCEEVALMRVGSSPHVRGAHLDRRLPRRESGIIPACAGSTSYLAAIFHLPRDHPRMCGEHRNIIACICVSLGSSPHVRGAQKHCRHRRGVPGIIPACAGSTESLPRLQKPAWDHPRMCGEHCNETVV